MSETTLRFGKALAGEIKDLILQVAGRLKPAEVRDFALNPENSPQGAYAPLYATWNDLSLASGYPGILIFFDKLERKGWIREGVAHEYVLAIKNSIEKNGLGDVSLFSGACGIAFAIQYASRERTRYQKMLEVLNHFIIERVGEVYLDRLEVGTPAKSNLYDLIQGLSGVGLYLLENLDRAFFLPLAERVTKALVELVRPISVRGYTVPGWFLPNSDVLSRGESAVGTFNLGLAHGVTGIIAYLSIAVVHGVEVEGQLEAIERIAKWIQDRSMKGTLGVRWPSITTWEMEVDGSGINTACRDAWCYGAPGVARALYLAGKALRRPDLMQYAQVAFGEIFSRSFQDWQLPGPMLCHGVAGLLVITRQMAQTTGFESLNTKAERLKKRLISWYNPDNPFGYIDLEDSRDGNLIQVNRPGLLDGACGVLLALMDQDDCSLKWHLPLAIHE